jgi:cation diffusion facilitator family transporter
LNNTSQQNIKIQRWVLILSVILLATKSVAYYLTNSVAVLTDALEAIVNVAAGIIGLYSLSLAAKPRDADHPYGHGKIEFVSAAAEGLMIAVAGGMILVEGIKHLINPEPVSNLDTGMMLVSSTAIANFILGAVCIRAGKRNNSLALLASGKHLHSDAYTTIGLLIGIFLMYITHIQWLDSVIALLFSVFILYTGFSIIRKSVAGIMDESDNALLEKLVTILNKNRRKNWIDLHNVRIIKYGSTLHLDSHLTVPWYLNVHEAHEEIEQLATIAKIEFDRSVELFVHSDGCLPISCPICIKDDCPVRQHAFQKQISWTVENIQADEKHSIDT